MTTQIAELLGTLLTSVPAVSVRRLSAKFPGDDRNLWFIGQHLAGPELQIECGPDGRPPFLIEGDERSVQAATVAAALAVITDWLAESP